MFGCDAPRDNPLDPNNPDNGFTSINGTVRTVSVPNQPISNVSVFWGNENILVKTNSDGSFRLEDLMEKDGYLYFEKNGYSPDSTFIEWNGRKNVTVIKQLNSIPQLVEGSMISSVENRFPDVQSYKLIVETLITDDENDVDSVYLFNQELNVNAGLQNISITRFQNEFTPTQLNILSIDEVIGKEFSIIAKDANGKTFNIAQLTVTRIIKELVETISPANNEVVSDSLTLNWRRFTPGYSFSYSLSIFTNTVDPDLVWQISDVSSEEIFYEVSDTLEPGDYFWVIWVIDDFGNQARSRPASFIIQ